MSSDNVILMFGEILHDEPAAVHLKKVADNCNLETAIVIGETEDGELFMGGNIGDMEKLVWLMFRGNNQMARIEAHFANHDEEILDDKT